MDGDIYEEPSEKALSTANSLFVTTFNILQNTNHGRMARQGFWDDDASGNTGEKMMMIVGEVAEAHEAIRHGNPPDDKIPDFTGAEAELADVVIRIFDLAGRHKWRVAEAIVAKMAHNTTRPRKHGKKL